MPDAQQGKKWTGPDRRSPERKRRPPVPGPGAAREIANRLRHPAVGLGLLAVAAPIVGAAAATDSESAETAASEQEQFVQQAAEAEPDLDERLAGELGAMRSERSDTIRSAVERHGITESLAGKIYDAASAEGIDPQVAYGLVRTESSFKNDAVSHVGARGLTQLMPRTARALMPDLRTDQLEDEDTNLTLGFRYLRQLIDKYDGDTEMALTAYNRGPGTVDKVLSRGGNPDNGYAGRVLRG